MKFSFELVTQNKIVVSGAASGIGLATSVAFLMEGAAKVALVRKKATTKHDFELQI
jgi:NAD(P)-dependent dehydrogenase (short-subunit alcohol dehydrogenase family)